MASGVSYLHHFKPTVIHGDLKGVSTISRPHRHPGLTLTNEKQTHQGNILIDKNGHAKITDFGVSKVIEDFSDVLKLPNPTSSFAGSTRWLAPELIWAMVEDVYPPVTTHSDVYAFGVVAMEVRFAFPFMSRGTSSADHGFLSYLQVLTGLLPFPLRKNDHGVTVDLLAGQKPSHCASMVCIGVPDSHASALCDMMDNCWHKHPASRPSMSSICRYLGSFTRADPPASSQRLHDNNVRTRAL